MILDKISIVEKLSLAILIFAISFCVGYFISKHFLHKTYVDNLWKTIEYLMSVREHDTFVNKTKEEYVDNFIHNINDSYTQGQYKEAEQLLKELQQKYSTIAVDSKFEQLIRKIR